MSGGDLEAAREQAAAWLMRFHEGPIDLEEELELELWLEAHPANRAALASVERAWRMAGAAAEAPELVAARADALKALSQADRQSPRGWRPELRHALGALAACLLLIVATFHFYPRGETFRTGIGERRVVMLDDGSRLSLDAASAVEVRYDGERRALRLLAGRARFEVAKDPRRPFTVTAGDRMVVATGTAFSVELFRAEMRVVLYQGSVSVLEDGPADQAPRHVVLQGDGRTPADRMLAPSTALIVPTGASAAARLETVDTARSSAWEQGQLVFSDEPLGVAVERVNRYSGVSLAIEDPVTAALPVSGTFNAGDTEAFIDGVVTLYGLRKLRRGETVILRAPGRQRRSPGREGRDSPRRGHFAISRLVRLSSRKLPANEERYRGTEMRGSMALLRMGAAVTVAASCLSPASAQAQASYQLDIPAQDMEAALKTVAGVTHEQIVFRGEVVRGKRSNALRGSYTADAAIAALIRGSGLSVSRSARGVFIVVAATASTAAAQDADPGLEKAVMAEQEIVVTGTHIAGAPVASPVLRIDQREMREAGQRDLGDVIRNIPSNYNGGQNPGARFQAGTAANTNASGSSALNLRGLGPDATLTLLNGRRLPYDGTAQAVDVSAIPLDAVAELQVMPDGASALYGSDAVGGVANIILRRDFEGVSTSLRFGTSTDGGGFLQEYGAVGGGRWGSGGALVALQYDRQNAVRSGQRDYTRYVVGPNTLLDAHKHFSGLVTAHQDITDRLTFSIDGLYSWRHSDGAEYSTVAFAATTRFSNENYAISPTLAWRLSGDWKASLSASYGANKTRRFDDYIDKVTGYNDGGSSIYDNYAYGGELDLDGRLFAIPGGDVRLAVGGGYRFNHLRVYSATSAVPTGDGRGNFYGFGELSVPLVSAANASPFLYQLTLSGALRHEEYDRFDGVTTPKLGLVYAPAPDLDLKLSWGRSFKAPTLRNEFQVFRVGLQSALFYGGNYPAGSTVLLTSGGNRDLKPERARTLSTTLDLHPRAVPGLKLSATYFDIDYTDRVVQPVSNATLKVLDNPALQEFIDYAPTPAQQAAVIARDSRGLGNYTGKPYDPAKVVAIIRNQLVNAARQRIKGVDLVGSYRIPIATGDVTLSGQASWLRSNQRNSTSAPLTQLAGTNFNPPRFRARGGATGHFGAFTGTLFANYAGGITDLNVAPPVPREGMTTLDLSLMWKAPAAHGPLKGFEFGLYVNNLTNARPPYLAPFDDTTVNYDSTNYSPLGRFVSVSLRKAW